MKSVITPSVTVARHGPAHPGSHSHWKMYTNSYESIPAALPQRECGLIFGRGWRCGSNEGDVGATCWSGLAASREQDDGGNEYEFLHVGWTHIHDGRFRRCRVVVGGCTLWGMKTSVYVGVSVDGFIARPDGSVDFLDDHAPAATDLGWSDFLASVDVMVMGRNTFDFVMNAGVDWPYGLLPVVSCSPIDRSTFPADFVGVVEDSSLGPEPLMADLVQRGFEHAYIDGGHTVQAFIAAGLIDELTLTTVPSVIGQGLSVFGADSDVRLELMSSSSDPNGFVQNKYRVLG